MAELLFAWFILTDEPFDSSEWAEVPLAGRDYDHRLVGLGIS
jgi:hypothetical protein